MIKDKFVTIIVHEIVETRNSEGEVVITYKFKKNIQGIILPSSGREVWLNEKENVLTSNIMTCEDTVLAYTDRIIYNSLNYDIIYIDNDPRLPATFDKFIKVYLNYVKV